jgi:agmatinase
LYSIRSKVDLERVPVHDLGDVDVLEGLEETLDRVSAVWSEMVGQKKIPIMCGGEHTITKASVDALPKDVGLINFDAHLDLRDEFLGMKLSHATFMRRIAERLGPGRIMEVGIRAFSAPEWEFCRGEGKVGTITPLEIHTAPLKDTVSKIKAFSGRFKHLYVTVDIDVLDPGFAPGVGNPEPDGLSTGELMTLVTAVMDTNIIGFDMVEVSPEYDSGQTAAAGAKVIFESIAALEAARAER